MDDLPSDSNGQVLARCASIFRHLAHLMRTPLSVISNDLTFQSTVTPSGELERPLKKCRDLADLIRTMESMLPEQIDARRIKVSEIIPDGYPIPQGVDELQLFCDPEAVKGAVQALSINGRAKRIEVENSEIIISFLAGSNLAAERKRLSYLISETILIANGVSIQEQSPNTLSIRIPLL